jgi:hypothetical protein
MGPFRKRADDALRTWTQKGETFNDDDRVHTCAHLAEATAPPVRVSGTQKHAMRRFVAAARARRRCTWRGGGDTSASLRRRERCAWRTSLRQLYHHCGCASLASPYVYMGEWVFSVEFTLWTLRFILGLKRCPRPGCRPLILSSHVCPRPLT